MVFTLVESSMTFMNKSLKKPQAILKRLSKRFLSKVQRKKGATGAKLRYEF